MRTHEEIAWLAGLYEGEGCVQAEPDGKLVVKFKMTDEDVLLRAKDAFGFGCVSGPYKPSGLGKKQTWEWRLTTRKAVAFLAMIFPWLLARRREQVGAALAKWKGYPGVIKRLTCRDVDRIKRRLDQGETGRSLARAFQVSESRISQIRRTH